MNEVKDILQSAASKSAETFNAESKFDKLAKEIASDYRKKGKSPEEALKSVRLLRLKSAGLNTAKRNSLEWVKRLKTLPTI